MERTLKIASTIGIVDLVGLSPWKNSTISKFLVAIGGGESRC